ncbi:hypothetical protein EST38_g7415 [Candolleomyces aberdarensis]|uniref:Cytochrome P450 n=1 Tax=Candolleomyces aberdarensis TaxID=2316362 RepID=A0A4Q2DHF1_9AGAR|nr:hypothetical protein EST38_g7415 [Candolleomyces aberdarensis]
MLVLSPAFDPLKKIPGRTGTFFQSFLDDVLDSPQESSKTHVEWRKLYGNTFKFQGFGRHDFRLMTFDFRAISHILTSPVYEKPWQTRSILARLIGRGIISMEGHEHKVQRKALSPAFSSTSVRELAPVLHSKAEELCDVWEKELSQLGSPDMETKEQAPALDTASGISRAVFDVMGLGGFDFAFDSLKDDSRPDHQPYRQMFRALDQGVDPRDILDLYLPFLRNLWPSEKTKKMNESTAKIRTMGQKIIEAKRARILAKESEAKDILSLLVKSNLSSTLSDADLLDQCSTFLFAGTDSVAIALTWALHHLSTHPQTQARLYDELKASLQTKGPEDYDSDGSDDSGYAEDPKLRSTQAQRDWTKSLESLPYLDNVVRETLRISPPIHSTIRVATKDDEIVLSEPISVDGRLSNSFKIQKGTYIHIPIEGINFAEDIWGSDALEFNPERWNNLPSIVSNIPGFGNVLTFGYGPHSCLGYRFAVSEIKVFLAHLVLRFDFAPVEEIPGGCDKPEFPIRVSKRA